MAELVAERILGYPLASVTTAAMQAGREKESEAVAYYEFVTGRSTASLGGQRETRPNGRLIAASKELRAALIRMLKVTMDHVEACDDWRKMDRAQRAAFAALAKASSSSRIKAKR